MRLFLVRNSAHTAPTPSFNSPAPPHMFAISYDTSSSTYRPSHLRSPTSPRQFLEPNRVAMDTSVQPFNTGTAGSPNPPPTDYPSISLDTEMLDEDEMMAMGDQDSYPSNTGLPPATDTLQPEPGSVPENLAPNKVHIRGLDNMSSADVTNYVSGHLSGATVEKLEWIDDTSLNLVYKDDATAAAVLTALSTESGVNANPWELREAKRSEAFPLARLDVRLAVATDRKEKGARERSRYYLFHPEEDRVEQEEKRRRERDTERRERRGNPEYRRRDYEDRKYRDRERDYDRDEHRSRSRYEEDDSRRKEPLELFPKGASVDRRAGRRSRSRSPVELFPESLKNAQVELFPETTKNGTTELFPEKAKNDGLELFPEERGSGRRKRAEETRGDTPPRTLFSIDDPVEMPKRGQSPPRQRRDRGRGRDNSRTVELFPEKTDKQRSLADRISGSQYQRSRNEDSEMAESDPGLSIRGAAGGSSGGGLNIRGAASGNSSGNKNAGIELLPDKASNSLFNRISEPGDGRRGQRRQKAEDMFG